VLRFAVIACSAALVAGAAVAAPTNRSDIERANDSPDKVICKRFVKTGSLVDSYRTCKTRAEWIRDRENLRQLTASESCANRGNGDGC
jgi:hypothetical protein